MKYKPRTGSLYRIIDKIRPRTGIFCHFIVIFVPERGLLDIIIMDLGVYIKEKRRKYGLSQVELALRSSVGVRFIKDMESGKRTLQMDKVNQVLGLFGEEMTPQKINADNEKS